MTQLQNSVTTDTEWVCCAMDEWSTHVTEQRQTLHCGEPTGVTGLQERGSFSSHLDCGDAWTCLIFLPKDHAVEAEENDPPSRRRVAGWEISSAASN
uniref:Uncharacterized protein n=1 Tax=Zea mays TaxID=4577 RepID=C0HIM0_MAIZE|nr:unknown [Zea mays]